MKIGTTGPRERILLMGPAGSGKSRAALSIAKVITGKMYVLDTETDTYERLLSEEPLDNVEYQATVPNDWTEMRRIVDEWTEKAERDDWIVIDSMSPTWSAVQTWFSDEVMGDDYADLMLAARKELKKGDVNLRVFEGWTDWQTINAQYARFMNRLLRANARGVHLLFTAEVDELRDDAPKGEMLMYGQVGMKARGNKRLPYVPHDILLLKQLRSGWEYQTVKVREPRKPTSGELTDFAKQYLLGVGGWKVQS